MPRCPSQVERVQGLQATPVGEQKSVIEWTYYFVAISCLFVPEDGFAGGGPGPQTWILDVHLKEVETQYYLVHVSSQVKHA